MAVLIYRAISLISDKAYVGKTSYALPHRIGQHIYEATQGCRRPFHAALRKYGIENFKVEIVDKADTEEMGNLKEKLHILLNACKVPNGYNVTDGGEGAIGRVFSQEHRDRISLAIKGKKWTPERSRRASLSRRGKKRGPRSPETKQKIAATLKGRPHSEERIKNIRIGIGRTHDNTAKQPA